MAPSRALCSNLPARAARCGVLAGCVAAALLQGCATADRTARQDVESLQTNVQQMESSLQARQAGVYEQIRDLREDQSRLERLIEENGRQAKAAGANVDRLRERTQEELDARDKLQRESAQAAAEQFSRLAARIDAAQKDLQKGFQTLNENLVAMNGFEKKQEERIAKMQEQLQSQLKVVVEEVGQENQELVRTLAAVRADLESVRQTAAEARQGLADLRAPVQQLAEKLAAAQGQIQELSRRQDAARKAAPARGGQHLVRAGDTLTTIAARYGVSVQALMEKNQITDANSLRVGQKLAVPEP
jgi:LysM repeat protein